MARCKQCNIEIPDGQDYCNNCLEDNTVKSDESYLDDLLQTMMSTQNEDSAVKSEKVVKKDNNVKIDIGKGEPVKDTEEVINTNEDVLPQYNGAEDNETEEFTDNTDDILALMQDFQESNELVEASEEDNNQTIYHNADDENQNEKLDNESDLTVYNPIDQDDNSQILDTDEDLLNLLDMISSQTEPGVTGADNLTIADLNEKKEISTDNSQAFNEDILAIDELLENSSSITREITGSSINNDVPNDVGKVFSDVVSAVDSLADDEKQQPTESTTVQQNQYFGAADNPSDKKEENSFDSKKKKSFFQKLFGKDESDVEDTSKQNNDKNTKKTNAKLKNSKKSKVFGKVDTESDDKNKTDKTAKLAAKNKKKADSKKKIKLKKVNSTLKAVKGIDDFDDSRKLNRTAVTLVFTFFSVLAAFIIIGTNMYSYSLGIKNATKEFERKRYTQAYSEIYGIDLKKKDYEIYDKIMTVMFVNKQLNSYNNYYTIGMYPEALDSLLKGLERYDKYIAKAKKLGIKSDLDYVRNQIINELESKFNLTEKKAKTLCKNNDQAKYSMIVINAASKK